MLEKKRKKIVFVGGHHTTALAVIQSLLNAKKEFFPELFWIGHKYSMWGDKNESAEYKEVTSLGIPFYNLLAGKFYRTYNPLKLIRIPFGFFQSLYYLLKIKPDLIVSFGGYLAVPVVLTGKILGITSYTHEQTTGVGFANNFISKFASKIFLTWENSLSKLNDPKAVLVGLPLREEILNPASSSECGFLGEFVKRASGKPLIYITGGKQGAHFLNELVKNSLDLLPNDYFVIHQCGSSTVYSDFETLKNIKNDHYFVNDYFSAKETGLIFKSASIVVGRSGANTVYELAACRKPAIFIPIPWVSHNEQRKNAEVLETAGSAVILDQDKTSPEEFVNTLKNAISNLKTFDGNAQKLGEKIILNASEKISSELIKFLART